MGFFDRQLHALVYDKGGAAWNVKHTDVGAVGDGSTDDRGAFATVDAAGRDIIVPRATAGYSIQSNLALAGNFHIAENAVLKANSTTTVTFNGEVHAGRYTIFSTSAGTYTLTQPERKAEWFGATSAVVAFTAGDETPSVAQSDQFKTANTATTAIRGLDDGVEGMRVSVLINDAFTSVKFATATALNGNNGVNWAPSKNDHMTCWNVGGNWYCDISNNTT